jgi:uncharacterized protein YndB with AHSA1/START domain
LTDHVSTEQDVLITRIFDVPREQVFKAWTDPDEVAAWYGPAHMDVPRDSVRIDARVGGRWEVTMVPRSGGQGFAIGYEIVELVEPELLVLRAAPLPELGLPDATTTRVEFHEEGRRTRVNFTSGPFTPDLLDKAEAGWTAQLDNLVQVLEQHSS